MSNKDYSITIPYNDFLKLQDKEKQLNKIKENIISCFKPTENDIIEVDITELKKIGIELLPSRFLEYSFNEVR